MEPLNEAILFSVFTRRIKKIRGIHNEIRSLLSLWLATVCISHARRYSYAIFKRCAIRITYSGGEKVGFKGARERFKALSHALEKADFERDGMRAILLGTSVTRVESISRGAAGKGKPKEGGASSLVGINFKG